MITKLIQKNLEKLVDGEQIDTELEKIEKAEEEVTSETIGVIDIEVHDDDSK